MSNIYILDSNVTEFQPLVTPEDESFVELVGQFDGTPITNWQPFRVEYEDDSLPRGDFPSIMLPHIPVFSGRAAEELAAVLSNSGQVLPLKCDDAKYFAFNVTLLLDALNVNTSEIVRFPSGRIMNVKSYVLEEKYLGSAPIFKLPETALMDVFVNDEFLRLVQKANLRGFSFTPVRIL